VPEPPASPSSRASGLIVSGACGYSLANNDATRAPLRKRIIKLSKIGSRRYCTTTVPIIVGWIEQ